MDLPDMFTLLLTYTQGVLGEAAALSATLRGCRALAQRSFKDQLHSTGAQLQRYPPQPPRDLSPPPQVRRIARR